MKTCSSLAVGNPDDLVFGAAPKPLRTRRGMEIGGGLVYPEINFTLPPMRIDENTMPKVREQYRSIIREVTRRAAELEVPGLVVEFETLPPMTDNPAWAAEITEILSEQMEKAYQKNGLKSALRVTPNDTRDTVRPPLMRRGRHWEEMLETFEGCAKAGAEWLSIESVGGKEVHDEALMAGDLRGVIFALCVLGARDMEFLWPHIADIARKHQAVAAGDTACGFGNTAMVLAEKKMIPKVFAAVVRAVSAARSLAAHECGAVGPGKDCGYENIILKVITGCPMANEGKSASCAHLSPLGNIAAAACDTWSNESVQNVKLLGAMAPVCSLEQLAYDCRLMNAATRDGPEAALKLRGWLVNSDAGLDPQAYILSPESAIAIARAIGEAPDYYQAGKAAALTAIHLMREAFHSGQLRIADAEKSWLGRMEETAGRMPDSETVFIGEMMAEGVAGHFIPAEYGLQAP